MFNTLPFYNSHLKCNIKILTSRESGPKTDLCNQLKSSETLSIISTLQFHIENIKYFFAKSRGKNEL